MLLRSVWLATALMAFGGGIARAQESESAWTSRGELGLEGRAFRDDGDALTEDQGLGMLGRLEARHRHGIFEQKARGFGRLDAFDRERTTFVAEETWAQAEGERLRLRLGVDLVNWSALEAFHPVDVINARNLDSDLENLEKIGEPMAALQIRVFEGTSLSAMFMPFFAATRFPSPRSRLNFGPPGVDLRDRRQLIDRNGSFTESDFGPQGAVQIRQVVRSADLTVHALEHMDRLQPTTLVDPVTTEVTLLYQTVRQVGGTYQQVFGPLIGKLEGAYRWFIEPGSAAAAQLDPLPNRNHGIIAAGLEYGVSHASGSQSTFLLEAETIVGVDERTRLALSPFQRDLFAGWRFARNDEASQELLVATIVDLERRREFLVNVTYRQRLGETWIVAVGVRIFEAQAAPPLEPGGLAILRNGDHARVALMRHF